jgi:hypothetical protein
VLASPSQICTPQTRHVSGCDGEQHQDACVYNFGACAGTEREPLLQNAADSAASTPRSQAALRVSFEPAFRTTMPNQGLSGLNPAAQPFVQHAAKPSGDGLQQQHDAPLPANITHHTPAQSAPPATNALSHDPGASLDQREQLATASSFTQSSSGKPPAPRGWPGRGIDAVGGVHPDALTGGSTTGRYLQRIETSRLQLFPNTPEGHYAEITCASATAC